MSADVPAVRRRVIVVGGGIAGLAAACRLIERARQGKWPLEVRVFESRSTAGGSILTYRRDGFLVEAGPDSFITQKPAALSLCRRLGIADRIIPTNREYRRVYVVRRGRLYAIPEGFLLLAPTRIWPFMVSRLFSWPGKLRMGLDLVLPRKRREPTDDESLADFVRRRFGREALERIAQPLVGGIYTADPERLSLRATMPRFLELEDRYRSVILGMRRARAAVGGGATADEGSRPTDGAYGAIRGRGDGSGGHGRESGARYSMFVSFVEGMETLPRAILSALPQGTVQCGRAVLRVALHGRRWKVGLSDATIEEADAVLLACPSYVSAELLGDQDPALAARLQSVEYASSAILTMGFRREQIRHPLDGFGFVVPAVEGRSIIAGTFGSVKFAGRAPEGHVLMRAFLGGAIQPHVYDMDDGDLRAAVLNDLRELLGVQGEPLFADLHRWPRSMPQYPVGHLHAVRRMEEAAGRWPGLALAGSAYGGVGIPDCVQSGEHAADLLLAELFPADPPANASTAPTGEA